MDFQKCIEFEAFRLYKTGYSDSSEKNWYQALVNLSFFPEEKINLPSYTNRFPDANHGGFIARFNDNGQWTYKYNYCRELFDQNYLTHGYDRTGFLFVWSDQDTNSECKFRVANCIREVETRLNLVELTKFNLVSHLYDKYDFLFVRPSSFWTNQHVRFSLFSIFLRAGLKYFVGTENCLKNALLTNSYAVDTMNAIEVFLKGYTDCSIVPSDVHRRLGWVAHFKLRNTEAEAYSFLKKLSS